MSQRRTPHPPSAGEKVGTMMTFVVRLTRDKDGRITGVVEQVKTGLRVRVEGLEAVRQAIDEMIAPPGD